MNINKIISILFAGFLILMLILTFIIPGKKFSIEEKRELQSIPVFSAGNLMDGTLADDIESYISDHIPFRKLLIELNAQYDRLSLRQTTKKIYVDRNGRLLERPCEIDIGTITENMDKINAFANTLGRSVDLMIIPSAGYICGDISNSIYDRYIDDSIITAISERAEDNVNVIDLQPKLKSYAVPDELYYVTDHHFTSMGANLAVSEYAINKGMIPVAEEHYTKEVLDGFRGSTYSRAAFWRYQAERMELWHSDSKITVRIGDNTYDSPFFYDNLNSGDMYTVFLGGNNSLVELQNHDISNGKTLLVVRDSFSNCMGSFFSEYYERVILIDLRYYKKSVSALCTEYDVDDILIEYSVGNYMTDRNLRRYLE